MSNPEPSAADGQLRSRWRKWRYRLLIGGIGVLVQSITITLPTVVRYVDAESGHPVSQLPVTAIWRLDATHPAGSNPSTVLKVQHLATNQNGEVRIGLAVMVHAPNFPLSLNMRSASSLPMVFIADENSAARGLDPDPLDLQRPELSLLSLQRTSIHGATFFVLRQTQGAEAHRNHERVRNLDLSEIQRADALCRQRWLCQED